MAAVSVLAAGTGLTVVRASADQLSGLQAQAQGVADHIQSLGRQEQALGEQFDAAKLGVQAAQAKVAAASAQVVAADASAGSARSALGKEALDAYTGGGTSTAVGSGTVGSATSSLLGAEYVDSMAASQRDALDRYRLAGVVDRTARAQLELARSAAQAQLGVVDEARRSAQASQDQLQGVYRQDQGQIATLVAQIQAQREAAAAAAARAVAAKAAADQAAADQAATVRANAAARAAAAQAAAPTTGGGSGGGSSAASPSTPSVAVPFAAAPFNPAPPPGRGASGAVAAALTRVGDPYVWGAAGPSAFDCSGLVAWAYAQAGISLPHYSGAQYNDGVHISMSQLQPGDLVFPGNPGDHVAMYIGGGQIVEAPYTGATVHVVGMGSWFVSAVRIA